MTLSMEQLQTSLPDFEICSREGDRESSRQEVKSDVADINTSRAMVQALQRGMPLTYQLRR